MPPRLNRRRFLARAAGASVMLSCSHTLAGSSDSADVKAAALLKAMTLDEKIGQMTLVDIKGLRDAAHIQKYALGGLLSGGDSDPPDITARGWARAHDEYQTWALKSRLKIPLLYGIDAVHGHNNVDGAVIFPHNIGLGATRNPELVERAARVTALEMAGTGIGWAFAPCIAVARDPRWGRTYESFGESPELVSALGVAALRGLQGKQLSDPTAVLACAKHFLGDGGTRGGIDQGDCCCDEPTLRKIHLAGYAAAVKAGVGSIMVSFSSWNGQKMHGNRHLLTKVLKGELGFKGFLVSDWAAIDQLAHNYQKAIELAINAGLDMAMVPNGPGQRNNYVEFIGLLKALVADGRVPLSRIDDAVRRILRTKLRTSLFEHPFSDSALTVKVGCAEHRQVARECVQQSLVLLKNTNHTLPLAKNARRLHVVGKAADDVGIQCGGWTIDWQGRIGPVTHGGTTILEGIRRTVGHGTQVTFAADGKSGRGADAVIAVIGELPYAEMKGDRKELALDRQDITLVQQAKASGVPVIAILLSGRPLLMTSVLETSDAVIAAWLPGTEGQGVADVLFGNVKPKGKLPHTWPASMAQVPGNDGEPIQGKPLFPYGYGLTW